MMATLEADRSAAAPFFKTPIPAHDEPELRRAPARVLATWPVGTFVENIHARADGSLIVSVHSAGELQRWRNGRGVDVLARLPASPAAINAHPGGGVVVAGDSVGSEPQFVWHVDDEGSVREVAGVPAALFFNGATPSERHQNLRPLCLRPNTDRALFLRIEFDERGRPGPIEIVAERLRVDDFTFDSEGNAYLMTHSHNSLMRLTPGGARINVTGVVDGMAGSTARLATATQQT